MTSLRQKPQLHPLTEHVIAPWDTFTIKHVWVGRKKKLIWVSGRQNEKIEEGGECHETAQLFSLLLPLCFLLCSVSFSSGHIRFNSLSLFSLLSSCLPQMNSMNSVSSSEDIKPPPGLQNLGNINYQCTSPGGMSKHICSICGDRSSGNVKRVKMGERVGKTNLHSRSPQTPPPRWLKER